MHDKFEGSAEHTKASTTPAGECKRVLKRVRDPGYREGQDAVAVIGRYQATVKVANKRIDAGAACADTVADRDAR